MKLVDDWKWCLVKSWSVWLGGWLTLLWLAVPEILFGFFGIDMSPAFVWIVAALIATLVPLARIVKQSR